MPSTKALPTIADHLAAFGGAVKGQQDRFADTRSGAIYQHPGGAAGILFSRSAQRDRDLYRAIYLDDADGADLTYYISQHFGIDRILDTFGTGWAVFARPNASFGADTLWKGTRIGVTGVFQSVREFAVAADTPAASTAVRVLVPIQATTTGPGWGVPLTQTGIRLDDPLADTSWTVQSIVCGDGTTFEQADDFRARARATRVAQRKGYTRFLIDTCTTAGAHTVALFESSWGLGATDFADDHGINAVYVADSGFTGSMDLARGCEVACEGARVLGADTMFRPMTTQAVVPDLSVTVSVPLAQVDQGGLARAIQGSVAGYFRGATNGFQYKLDAIAAAARVSPLVQDVTVNVPTSDVILTPGAWPATLVRYTVQPQAVIVRLSATTI